MTGSVRASEVDPLPGQGPERRRNPRTKLDKLFRTSLILVRTVVVSPALNAIEIAKAVAAKL